MTFPRNSHKNQATKQQARQDNQAGVTLLLSILVLSAIVAISFSFASIILIEIRSSGDVARTEPAYYAVQGVVEETIFKIKRQIPPLPPDSTDSYNFDFGTCGEDKPINNVGSNVATQNAVSLYSGICNTNPSTDVKDRVPPTAAQDPANTKTIYSLYDPNNPYENKACNVDTDPRDPDCDGGSLYPSAYDKVEFYYLASPGGQMRLYFCEASKDCFNGPGIGDDNWDAVRSLNSTPGNQCVQFYDSTKWSLTSGCSSGGAILADKSYQIFVVNTSSNLDAGIQIKSWGPDPPGNPATPTTSVAKGLAVFGQYSVNVTASFLGLTRKYLVNIPSN